MPLWRASRREPAPCPRCDARLPPAGELAGEACPSCGQKLLPVQVAGFGRKLLAATVDAGILLVVGGLLNAALLWMVEYRSPFSDSSGLGLILQILAAEPMAVLSPIVPFLFCSGVYFVLFWATMGRTLGQTLLRIQVVDARGRVPSPLRSLLRLCGMVLGLLPGGLGLLWSAFDEDRRAFHDHVAGTFVVRNP